MKVLLGKRKYVVRKEPPKSPEPVLSEICVHIGRTYFPRRKWDDFSLAILGWWTAQLADFLTNKKVAVQCSFMDGPYMFTLDAASIQFFKHGHLASCEPNSIRITRAFTKSILAASRTLLDEVMDTHSQTADYKFHRRHHMRLERIMSRKQLST